MFRLQADLRTGTALANKTLMAEAQLDPRFHPHYVELHRHWWGPMRSAIERAVERGELRAETDPGLMVDMLLGTAWYRLLLEHAPLDTAAATALVDTILDGLRPPAERTRH